MSRTQAIIRPGAALIAALQGARDALLDNPAARSDPRQGDHLFEIQGLSYGPPIHTDATDADGNVIRVITDDKLPDGVLPADFSGIPTEIVRSDELHDDRPLAAGARIVPFTSPASFGTVAFAGVRGEKHLVVTCSHVAAPSDDAPQRGYRVMIGNGREAALVAFTDLVAGDGCPIDAAVCSVPAPAPLAGRWPDGAPFVGTGSAGRGPYTIFGAVNSGTHAAELGPEQAVNLALPGGVTVRYAGQRPLRSAGGPIAALGDSGAAVRDGAGRLVAMVVGFTDGGRTAWCTPWERIDAWLAGAGATA
jgi:hypothetical protein